MTRRPVAQKAGTIGVGRSLRIAAGCVPRSLVRRQAGAPAFAACLPSASFPLGPCLPNLPLPGKRQSRYSSPLSGEPEFKNSKVQNDETDAVHIERPKRIRSPHADARRTMARVCRLRRSQGSRPLLSFHGGLSCRLDVRFASNFCQEAGIRLISVDRPGIGLSDHQPDRHVLDWPEDVAHLALMLGIYRFAVAWLVGRRPLRFGLRSIGFPNC